MSDKLLLTLPLVGLSGIKGVLLGSFMAIGFGMGRSFGKIACEKIDYLEDSISVSIDSFTKKWR